MKKIETLSISTSDVDLPKNVDKLESRMLRHIKSHPWREVAGIYLWDESYSPFLSDFNLGGRGDSKVVINWSTMGIEHASGMLLFHSHPSGRELFSVHDIESFKRVCREVYEMMSEGYLKDTFSLYQTVGVRRGNFSWVGMKLTRV